MLTSEQFQAFVFHLFPCELPEFQGPHGKLRPLILHVAAVMMMHFDYLHRSYTVNHRCCRAMCMAAVKANIAASKTEAIRKLQRWSLIIKDDFRKANCSGSPSPATIGRRDLKSMLEKINQNVATLLRERIEQQAHHAELKLEMSAIRSELSALRTSTQSLNEIVNVLVTQNRMVLLQNRLIGRKVGVEVNNEADNSQELRRLNADLARLGEVGRDEALPGNGTPPARAQQGGQRVTPPENVVRRAPRVQDASLRLQPPEDRTGGKKGVSSKDEHLEKILKDLYDLGHVFPSLSGAAPYLDEWTTQVWSTNVRQKDRAQNKVRRILKLVDAMWTKEDRQRLMEGKMGKIESSRYFEKLAKDCLYTAWIFSKRKKKSTELPGGCKTTILGMANLLAGKDEFIDKFIPRWDGDGKMESRMTLSEATEDQKQKVKRTLEAGLEA